MATKIGLNGFGRIGRYLTRLLAGESDLELVAVNARASNEDLAHLLKYDSVHGRFLDVEPTKSGFKINGKAVTVTRDAPGEWKWGAMGCDIVVESTGKFTDRASCEKHLACGAKKVLISAPGKDADITVVMSVNDSALKPEHTIISNASCTTNCLAPVAKVINDTFGIRHGIMTTVHSYTMSQRILDGSHKDMRRARACAVNMVPTTTGAAKAVGLVIPELNGVLDGMAIRVPTPNVSLVDLVCELKKPTTVEEVNAALKAAANDSMGYTEEPLVSVDFMGSTFGGVVDSGLTRVMGTTQLKLIVWYDNEAGFTNQLLRLTRKAAGLL
ncbi:MAG: type I glyceraldehyde-3-phosphate dehydrogenase [Pseudodesulfovibrio sp.]|uniref:Glyceraldehyde-3-phosphate dehydrogenase n=1 Tax=Pseudodesulfovibrio aespoeensis (strain ATCC 700646 / DSM 10631 / Aspo-2) TaxID=643562 RepID=E6VYJ5_PSEA9|nr:MULTISPECIES: type I glyceraldehyde-3-phosphate dehydrogenase [Pseudodesulfovibrio]MBU4243874.1 type I glyceraldehyde-3-phosphate dehydrogenase [Pseudomonadota bacterium]ADU62758.1 glyceraldehyde-3-phosphate dehydrogenase, type I [Pseudodesulfovibrio aespoeensis Aspo-2]MBU4380513.1 type I glyceraldehyde-3-phosphate dehydrogenase [Pseudomonadota bacterium]MBU4474191.1 type I glyceraldehyde-3-phosphate dehydrogenase [Pseudomonadota bacterium]MBU4515695.1 type I glyceraldehyde-3-phosphate dehy